MKIPELNGVQRFIFLTASTVLMIYQTQTRNDKTFIFTTLIVTTLLILAFIGKINDSISTILKYFILVLLVISIAINFVLYKKVIANKEILSKTKSTAIELFLAKQNIKNLQKELEEEKFKNTLSKKTGIPKEQLFLQR